MEEINIKIRTYYFRNDIISIENFHPTRIKIDKKSYKIPLFITLGILLSKLLAI